MRLLALVLCILLVPVTVYSISGFSRGSSGSNTAIRSIPPRPTVPVPAKVKESKVEEVEIREEVTNEEVICLTKDDVVIDCPNVEPSE